MASGMRLMAPTVPWIVSRRVSPVNTRIVSCCSAGVSVFHDWTSFDSGIFSGSQKLLTRRFQTSASLSSWMRFQLIAWTAWMSGMLLPVAWTGSVTVIVRILNSRVSGPKKSGWGEHGLRRGGGGAAMNSEHAADAAVDLSALERQLTE